MSGEQLPAAEERRVLLPEDLQTAVWADAGDGLRDAGHRRRAGCHSARGGREQRQPARILYAAAEVDPGVELEKPEWRIGPRKQDGNDGEVRVSRLTVKRQVVLAELPWPEPVGADEHRHGPAAGKALLQGLGPTEPGDEVPAIEKDAQAAMHKRTRYALDRRVIAPVIA